MVFNLETAKSDFRKFWENIGAEGDLHDGLKEWDRKYNASDPREDPRVSTKKQYFAVRVLRKLKRIIHKTPSFIRNA